MATLEVHFQDGFANDSVSVQVGGRVVYRKEGVSTDLTISRADAVSLQVPDSAVTVEVAVPSRNLSRSITVQSPPTTHLGVSLVDGALDLRPSQEPFYYM